MLMWARREQLRCRFSPRDARSSTERVMAVAGRSGGSTSHRRRIWSGEKREMRGRAHNAIFAATARRCGTNRVREIFKEGSVVILLGTGGVGKTTIAASLGLAAASKRFDTAVIT